MKNTTEQITLTSNVITIPPSVGDGRTDDLKVRDIVLHDNITTLTPSVALSYIEDVDRAKYIVLNNDVFITRLTSATITSDVNAPVTAEFTFAGGERMSYADYVLMILPAPVKEHLYQWCDPRLQGMTNEDVVKTKMLKDLSGHGYDYTLYNFAGNTTSGIDDDGALYFDGVNDYAVSDRPRLADFTVIVDADCYKGQINPVSRILCYIISADYPYGTPGRPLYLAYDEGTWSSSADREAYFSHSFGAGFSTKGLANKEGVNIFMPSSLNGHPITRGTAVDNKDAKLCLADLRAGRKLYTKIRYRSIINFDKSLTDSQLHIVRKLMLEHETPRWLTILQSMSSSLRDALYCWHNPRLQGLDNQSLEWLWDLSGNGHDCRLNNFAGTQESGMREDGGLQFDGVDDNAFESENFSIDNPYASMTCLLNLTIQSAPVFTRLFMMGTDEDCNKAIPPLMLSEVNDERVRFNSNQNQNSNFLYYTDKAEYYEMRVKFDTPRYKYFNNQRGGQALASGLPPYGRLGRISYGIYNRTMPNSFVRIPQMILYSMIIFTRELTSEEIAWCRRYML